MAESGPVSLTTCESQILELLATGMTIPQIAERLCFSTKSIGASAFKILEKLNVHRLDEAVLVIRKNGMVDQ